jgi:hypothetical protein
LLVLGCQNACSLRDATERSKAMVTSDKGPNGAVRSAEAYEVGYGKPPTATRFGVRPQPVRSKRGSSSHPDRLDIAALLEGALEATINGRKTKLHPHEAMLHGLFQRAAGGQVRAIKLFLEECKRARLLDPPHQPSGAVIQIPTGVSADLGGRLLHQVGRPPWDPEVLELYRAEYERDLADLEKLKQEAKAQYASRRGAVP